jgi:hypothetical protein
MEEGSKENPQWPKNGLFICKHKGPFCEKENEILVFKNFLKV